MIDNNSINYEKKYKLLCERINDFREECIYGSMMSISESIHGRALCETFLGYINKIDKKYPTE